MTQPPAPPTNNPPILSQHLPPGYEHECQRQVCIPRYPNAPLRPNSHDTYIVDVSHWLAVIDGFHEEQLKYATAWWGTLSYWQWVSENAAKAVAHRRMQFYLETSGESRSYIREFLLPQDHDYVYWKSQSEWLKSKVEAIGKAIETLRSYNANLRASFGHNWNS